MDFSRLEAMFKNLTQLFCLREKEGPCASVFDISSSQPGELGLRTPRLSPTTIPNPSSNTAPWIFLTQAVNSILKRPYAPSEKPLPQFQFWKTARSFPHLYARGKVHPKQRPPHSSSVLKLSDITSGRKWGLSYVRMKQRTSGISL